MKYEVLLFYKYVSIEDPQALASSLRQLCERLELTGRVIIAEEGINATLEGTIEAAGKFIVEFFDDPRFADITVKRSEGTGNSFPKLSIKVREEIVGTHFPKEKADPRVATAPRITPETLRSWYETKRDFVVVDMRNDYEYASGHFEGSVNPGLAASRDLVEAVPSMEPLKNKTVVTVCTGGIRCEKMSAYLQSSGFSEVYQLENGIHGYMEKYPGKDFLGTLYTFDNRLTMHFGGDRVIVGTCKLCDAKTENYINCANNDCHLHFLVCDDCQSADGKTFCSPDCAARIQTLDTVE
ncbi:MAG: rhodanese-related sulfurtransferase [Minisyncoccia bacterium]